MIVTEITELTKARVRVELDGEFAFVLYKGELRVYGIEKEREMKEAAYNEIMNSLLPKRAKLRAMNLLKNRSYTTAQLKEKLKAGEYPEKIIEEAIAYVTSFGYVDDSRYAFDFIEYHKETKSKNRIVTDLLKKGISGAMIEEAWKEAAGDDRQELEKKQIIRWMEKKHFSPQTAAATEKQKMMAFLYRKGFTIETIRSVLSLDITTN